MADDVTVTIGATISQLNSQIDAAKHKIEEIASPITKIQELFGTFAKVAGEAFALEMIHAAVEKFAELGEKIERTSVILGISTGEVQKLNYIAALTGGSAEGMAMSIERMQLTLQRASSTGIGPAANALAALNLRAKDLIGLPINEQIKVLSGRFQELSEKNNLSAEAMALLGRRGAEMLPMMIKFGASIDNIGKDADHAGMLMSTHTVEALASLNNALNTANTAASTFAGTLIGRFAPSLEASARATATLFGELTKIVEKGSAFQLYLLATSASLALMTGNVSQLIEVYKMLRKAINDLPSAHEAEGPPKPPLAMPDLAAQAAIARAGIETQLAQTKGLYEARKILAENDLTQMRSTETQKTNAVIAATQERIASEIAAQKAIMGLYAGEPVKYAQEKKRLVELEQQADNEILRLQLQAAAGSAAAWRQVFDTVQGAWDNQLRGLLEHTTTWADAMKHIVEDLIIEIIKQFEKAALAKAALGIAGAGLDIASGGIGGALFGGISRLFSGGAAPVPEFQEGTGYVPRTSLAMVHKGEMVIPPEMADAIRGGGGGLGSNVNVSISAWDGASVSSWLRGGGSQLLAQALKSTYATNPTLRPMGAR